MPDIIPDRPRVTRDVAAVALVDLLTVHEQHVVGVVTGRLVAGTVAFDQSARVTLGAFGDVLDLVA